MIKVLINDSFKKFLIRQPAAYRQKVRQKFEYLEIGYWEGGLKVKKIKSVASNKAIFEGRLDRSNRILFTLGGENEIDSPDKALLVYVWGIVSHDDISSGSRNIPVNVPFLQFKPYQQDFFEDTLLEDFEESYRTQESITQKVFDDSATQKWHYLTEGDWKRIEDYRQDEFELALYLTPQQKEVLNQPLPTIVSGTAGSGKTTLGIYYLLKLPLAKEKKLFITYNHYLKNAAFQLYHGLLNATPLQNEFIDPDFYTFKDYCLKVVERHHQKFSPEKEVNFERFSELISSNNQAHKFDGPLIWEEIRSIIKGALPQINLNILKKGRHALEKKLLNPALLKALQQQFIILSRLESLKKIEKFVRKYLQIDLPAFSKNLPDLVEHQSERVLTIFDRVLEVLTKERELTRKKFLSSSDYEALGQKKAPNFPHDRKIIYRIFEWYQDQLDREGWWDELDLSREVMNLLSERDAEESRYDLVVCDEVQDLTDAQHELLFHIVRNPLGLLLSGDTKQIINPSGFRWEELKRHFYERELKIPEIQYLNLNFRSSGSIVELSNTLLELKFNLLGTRAEELKEDWKYKGRPPVVVHHLSEQKLLENVQSTGAKKTILVRTEEEKNRLKKTLETELIFTIYEAKGLEFDTVLLWKFTSDVNTSDVWKVILNYSSRDVHQANIRHEINLLYVAITRAQKDLLIYDGRQSSLIWNSEAIRDKIYTTDDLTYIGSIWDVISTPEEWREQGDYFFEREYFKAAMECFKNAGEDQLVLKARACQAEKTHDYPLAASCFEKIGELDKSALYYEKSGDYEQAFRLWKQLKHEENAFRCRLKLLAREERFAELADIYLSEKDYPKAAEMLAKAGIYDKAARVSLEYLKDRKNAALYYEKAALYREAARLHEKMKQWENAAELYEKAREYHAAIKLWKRLKREDRLIPLYHQMNDYASLLKIYEKARDFDRAIKVLGKLPDKSGLPEEARQLFEQRKYFPALLRFYLINDQRATADCYYKLRNYAEAGHYYELAAVHNAAANAFQKAKDYKAAFTHYLQSEEDREQNFSRAKRISRQLSYREIEEEARRHFQQHNYEAASFCFWLIHDYVNAGISDLENNRHEKTTEHWKKALIDFRMLNVIARYCLMNERVEFGAKFFLEQLPARSRYIYSDFRRQYESWHDLMQLMDQYFESHPNREELLKWVDILEYLPVSEERETKKTLYLEKSGDYNRYSNYLGHLAFYYPEYFKQLKKQYQREYKHIVDEISEIAAIKLFVLEKYDDFNRVVEKLELTEDNYEIFAKSERCEEAIGILLQKGEIDRVRWILIDRQEFLRLAQIFEQYGELESAAHYYGVSGDYVKSGILFEGVEKFSKAGDAYYKAKNYRKALEMYIKTGRSKAKIAQTYERLGDYNQAAKIWKEMGKIKKYQKCMQKLQGPGLFD